MSAPNFFCPFQSVPFGTDEQEVRPIQTKTAATATIAANRIGGPLRPFKRSDRIRVPEYPALLREINDPPPILFRRGLAVPARPAIAVVGARRATRAGLEAARLLSAQLAAAGVVVVSGFARGVDAAAHRAALEAGGHT